jgi:hypothetical protein
MKRDELIAKLLEMPADMVVAVFVEQIDNVIDIVNVKVHDGEILIGIDY